MREFSEYERGIIKKKLIAGSNLSGMLSHEFFFYSELLVTIKLTGTHQFKFASDVIVKEKAFGELIDLITLLQFLLDNGLIIAYPTAATVMRFYDKQDETISLGNGRGSMTTTWNTTEQDTYIGDFIKRHENSRFKATEPLVMLTKHNWKTWDERKHQQGIWVAIGIALITAIIGAAGIWFQYYESTKELNEVRKKQERLEAKIDSLSRLRYVPVVPDTTKVE